MPSILLGRLLKEVQVRGGARGRQGRTQLGLFQQPASCAAYWWSRAVRPRGGPTPPSPSRSRRGGRRPAPRPPAPPPPPRGCPPPAGSPAPPGGGRVPRA